MEGFSIMSDRIDVKVITEDGDHWNTFINATFKEANKYYMGQTFENHKHVVRVYDLSKDITHSYFGQCDKLRKKGASYERAWKTMIKEKQQVKNTILNNVDFSGFLDEDETIIIWFEEALREDTSTALYKSTWGFTDCYFIQTCGFEFIFI